MLFRPVNNLINSQIELKFLNKEKLDSLNVVDTSKPYFGAL